LNLLSVIIILFHRTVNTIIFCLVKSVVPKHKYYIFILLLSKDNLNGAKMETILGIKGPDFVMLAADCTQAHSIITLKEGK
jgi:hypothetical protein